MDEDLEEQMKMLEGLDLGVSSTTIMNEPQVAPVQPSTTVQPNVVPPTLQTSIPNQVVQPQVAPIQPSTTVQSQTQHIVNTNVNTDDIMNQAPVFVNLANDTYQTETDFLHLKEGEKTKITLVNLNFIRNHIHYIEGLGRFRCLSTYDSNNKWPVVRAACCQIVDDKTGKAINAKNRLLVPVIEYPVSKTDGKTLTNDKPKLKMWDMNYVEEKALRDILDNYKTGADFNSIDLSSFDLILTKAKSDMYSTITLVPITPSLRPQFINDINECISKVNQDFYNTAYKESAKVVSEETIIKFLENKNNIANQAQNINNQLNNMPSFEDMMKQ